MERDAPIKLKFKVKVQRIHNPIITINAKFLCFLRNHALTTQRHLMQYRIGKISSIVTSARRYIPQPGFFILIALHDTKKYSVRYDQQSTFHAMGINLTYL